MRSSVVLPEPFGPIKPTRSPRITRNDASRTIGPVSERLADVLGLEHHLPGPVAGLGLQPDAADLVAAFRALLAHGHQRADPPLVARAPGLDALAQPRLFLREPLVELLVLDGLVREPVFLLSKEGLVVARPGRQPAAIELDDAGGDALQKRAVVGDEHDGAAVVVEEASRARSSPRCRGDWSARRAAADRAARRARARAAHGAASRRTSVDTIASAGSPSREITMSTLTSTCQRSTCCRARRSLPPRLAHGRSVESGTSCTSRAMRSPGCRHTLPASGRTSPPMICSSVDLPVPFRPITHTRSPARSAGSRRRAAADGRRPS